MSEKETLDTELHLKATAELQQSVAADLEQEDGDIESLLENNEDGTNSPT